MYIAEGKITPPEDYFASGAMNQWRLVESFKHPHDNYLWYVLATKNDKLVSWLYNGQCPGCAHGHYETTMEAYKERCAQRS